MNRDQHPAGGHEDTHAHGPAHPQTHADTHAHAHPHAHPHAAYAAHAAHGSHADHRRPRPSTARVVLIASLVSALIAGVVGGAAGVYAGYTSARISVEADSKGSSARDSASAIREGGLVGRDDSPSSGSRRLIIDEESAVIDVVRNVSPSVVSIIVTRELRTFDPSSGFFGGGFSDRGTTRRETGGGTGFIVSKDGMILTNKHVVSDLEAEYSVLTNDGKTHKAVVLARDPTNDIAIIQIEGKDFPAARIGDSANAQIGQKVIAIGNALGEYRNTVSTGVISGLARNITATDGTGSRSAELRDVIQTDAAINPGNSGGPLLDIEGRVIGINSAVAQGAQNIGFALPIDEAKADLDSVKRTGKIVRPILGVRYIPVNPIIQQQGGLGADYGAYIPLNDVDGPASITAGGPADTAGVEPGDIILEISGTRLDEQSSLPLVLADRKVGDKVELKVLRDGKTLSLDATLGSASF